MDRALKRPIAGKAEFLQLDPFPLIRRDIQDEQLVSRVHPRIDAKINGLKGVIVSITDEVIDLDEADFPFIRASGQIPGSVLRCSSAYQRAMESRLNCVAGMKSPHV